MKMDSGVVEYLERMKKLIGMIDLGQINRVINMLKLVLLTEKRLFIAGNGGSAATASHLVCDWMKGVGKKKFRVVSLVDNEAILSAYANDISYDSAF